MPLKQAASEKRSLQTVLQLRDTYEKQATTIISRLANVTRIEPGATVVDVGAAQGMFLMACQKLGYEAVGVEPWAQARELAQQIAENDGASLNIVEGTAESLPFPDESVNVIHARSVIEHVRDAQGSFEEAFRVLRPGGVLWFGTASSMCPQQSEIARFPAFGWYPDFLKLRIMAWCNEHHPELIGHGIPAIHWFTPWKAKRMLRKAGFNKIYDRWDLRLPNEGGRRYRFLLNMIRRSAALKFAADVVVPGCSYAAVKAP